jgi:hypothetical protein
MAPTGLTFRDIQIWAMQDFPAEFKLLPDAKAFRTQFNIVWGYSHDNNLEVSSSGTPTPKQGSQ